MAHSHINEGLARFRKSLVIFGEPAIAAKPCQCPLNNPPPRQDMKSGWNLWWVLSGSDPEPLNTSPPVLDDFQCPAKMLLHPGLQALVVSIGPDQPDPREQDVQESQQQHAAELVMEVCWMNLSLQHRSFGIDKDLPLTSFNL